VVWAEDLKLNKPTKVTVFDTDYVIAKVPSNKSLSTLDYKKMNMNDPKNVMIVAMEDQCPHKLAALSEGRVTSSGYFQCAYHGWSFDASNNGECVEIPQIYTEDDTTSASPSTARACGKAVPAMIHQNMVWLFPFGSMEQALSAPPPPSNDEVDNGFKMTTAIRDMPIDYTLLLENILDPDHGLFAHNTKGKGFDLYTASKDFPQSLEVQVGDGGNSVSMTSRVEARQKLLSIPSKAGEDTKAQKKTKQDEETVVPIATSKFQAPCYVESCRRDPGSGDTKFVSSFWICPTGVGRSRFMSSTIYNLPFKIPRWLTHLFLNGFLDQDTFLLATQQAKVLPLEAKMVKELMKEEEESSTSNSSEDLRKKSISLRKKSFVYRSPTEVLSMRIGSFWDQTVLRMPKRIDTLLAMDKGGQLSHLPPRSSVLDLEKCHLQICPDSQDAVENCDKIQRVSKVLFSLTLLAKMVSITSLTSSMIAPNSVMNRIVKTPFVSCIMKKCLSTSFVITILSLSALASWLSSNVRKYFFFRYEESFRDKDLDKMPTVWADPM